MTLNFTATKTNFGLPATESFYHASAVNACGEPVEIRKYSDDKFLVAEYLRSGMFLASLEDVQYAIEHPFQVRYHRDLFCGSDVIAGSKY
jgi:hypothetical protein